jgi:alpha-glucosidase
MAALAACLPVAAADPAATVRSPDGRIAVSVDLLDGRPGWSVSCDGAPLLQRGGLGVELAEAPLQPPFEIASSVTNGHDATWRPVWGAWSEVRDRWCGRTVTLREADGARRLFEVEVRAYNEGVGLRYGFPKQPGLDRVMVKRRLTEYRFADDPKVWQCRNYEYGTKTIGSMSKSEGAVTVEAGGGRLVALTDADRGDFSQISWERKKDASGTIVGTLHSAATGAAPWRTSWETVIIGDSPAALFAHRRLVENLNPPCAVADTSWIRSGRAICQVRNTRMVTSELKALADFASANGMDYLEIDHSWSGAETKWTPEEIAFFAANHSKFWNDKPEWRRNVGGDPTAVAKGWVPFRPKADTGGNYVDLDVPALCAHGRSLNPPVGICLYVRGAVLKEFGGEHAVGDVFATYERWGVAGVKPGFVPPASQQNERAIAAMVRQAAEHKLILCIHDAYYPSGLSRTYPNLVNVEGVAGEEAEHSIPPAIRGLHDVMLPFTRALMGPVDYTPEFYKKDSIKTHCHQVAMLGVYPGRASMRGGMRAWSPGGEGGPEIEFVRRLPGLFDEERTFARLGERVTVARRKGGTWYVAGMGDGTARSFDLSLDFLAPGVTYEASLFSDAPGGPSAVATRRTVDIATVLPVWMAPNGGHLAILEPVQRR